MDSFDSLSHATSEEITFFHPVFDASCPEQYVLNPEPLQVLTWKTGSGVLVSIPPEYAATLDRVRAARLRKEMDFFPAAARTAADQADHEALGNYLCRALPEEFVPNVNRMPCPSLVRRIVLLDGSNPMDALVRQLDGDPKYCSAAQPTPNGEVFFFQTFTNEWLGSLLTHPWAHLLRWDLERSLYSETNTLLQQFHAACLAEQDGPLINGRPPESLEASDRIWADCLERILTCEDTDFDVFLTQAPCRCMILGRALNTCLNWAEFDGSTGTEHARWRWRAAHMEACLPQAVAASVEVASQGGAASQAATNFVAWYGSTENLNAITGMTRLDLSGKMTTGETLQKLMGVTWLSELHLSRPWIHFRELEFISVLPLKSLDLSWVHLGAEPDRVSRRLLFSDVLGKSLQNVSLTHLGLSDKQCRLLSKRFPDGKISPG